MKVAAVIADIVESRKLRDRGNIQEELARLLDSVNEKNDGIASPYTITLGDEFQAVYRHTEGMFEDFWRILAGLHPVKVRFSVGVGDIVTDLNPEEALGMDGPAFHRARDGIEADLAKSHALFHVEADVKRRRFVNKTLDLISKYARTWKKNRFEILCSLFEAQEAQEIAERIDISVRAVYKNIDKGGLEEIVAISEEIETICQEALKKS